MHNAWMPEWAEAGVAKRLSNLPIFIGGAAMPWKIQERNGRFCVVKSNGDGSTETVHCHADKKRATAQLRALYASEGKTGKELTAALMQHEKDVAWPQEDFQKLVKSWEEMEFVPWGPTSFSEYEEQDEAFKTFVEMDILHGRFISILENILWSSEVKDKPAAMHKAVDEYKVRADKVGMSKESGGSPTQASTNQREKGVEQETSLFDRIVLAVKERFGLVPKERNAFMVWKDTESGAYRWLAVYSNKWRDQDFPPEILSAQAHKDFIERVEKGEDPYPELWHWHTPGTKWGQSDWLAFTDEGFALASGYVLPGHEKEAEALMGMTGIRTSHGMPIASIERSADDQTVITRYSSKEISDLPAAAAANMLTDFSVLEVPMPIPDNKKEYLKRVGLDDATIEGVERALGDKAKAAEVLGMEHKSAEASDETQAQAKQEAGVGGMQDVVTDEVKGAPTTAPATETVAATETPAEDQPPTRKEVAEILGPILESLKSLTEKVTALDETAKALKAKQDENKPKEAQPVANVPSILASILGLSPVGKEAAAVKGNDPSARGPKETEPSVNQASKTGIPLLDFLTAPVPKE